MGEEENTKNIKDIKEIKITGGNFVNGVFSNNGNKFFTSKNPNTLEEGPKFYESTPIEINNAVDCATNAFAELKQYSNEKRAAFLESVATEIVALGDQLLNTINWETALPRARCEGERQRTTTQLQKFAEYIRQKKHEDIIIDDSDESTHMYRTQIPIGPVVVFEASNFPQAFGVCGGDTVSAWAAGCPVIAKAHPSHPQTAELFANAVLNAIKQENFPMGTFSLIQGKTNDTGKFLIQHDGIKAAGFTGSLQGGRSLYLLGASRPNPIPVYAEMGSINPIFLTKNTVTKNYEQLAQTLADSTTLGGGQFCTKADFIFLPKCLESNTLIDLTTNLMKNKTNSPLLNSNICSLLEKDVKKISELKNISILIGAESKGGTNSCVYSNTLLKMDAQIYLENKKIQKEYFGPVAIFVLCDDDETTFLNIANGLEGQLTATIHLEEEDYSKIQELLSILEEKAGRIIFNGVPTGVAVSPAMHHGGPYPATTAPLHTSVGMTAIRRFLRPICYQNMPNELFKNIPN